ncbi:MAG: trypsin-like peptidase domain-containing protein [Patescibacteria group bacterium]|nr:trypsin-like peptidase domain-containing protein [Patescibacteria group bacterium]
MNKNIKILFILSTIFLFFGLSGGLYLNDFFQPIVADDLALDEQEATIRAIKKVKPAVVSIIVYDYENFIALDTPSGKQEIQKYKKEQTRGTGFLITDDGFILSNKHVIGTADKKTGEYKVILNSGKEYYAQYIDMDLARDLAVIKIFDKGLPCVEIGDSDQIEIGMSVIAIGNILGRYENSVTKGIISAVGRTLTPSNIVDSVGVLENIIQTDAQINIGNSGGPLIDLDGKVLGINVAIDSAGGSIGFAIPINDARSVISSIRQNGYIAKPRLGVRYQMLTPDMARKNNLGRNSGAWITPGGEKEPAVVPGGPADKSGILENDIIFEVNAIKIEGANTLLSVIQKFKPEDKIGLKLHRNGEEMIAIAALDEMK